MRPVKHSRILLPSAVAAGLVLVAGACGGSSKAAVSTTTTTSASAASSTSSTTVAATTTTTSTSTTVPATTTTTVPPAPTAPLTGLLQPDPTALARSAVVVKIDNVDAARPQTGVNQADVVYEEMVEGGLTRLAAVFQSQLPDPVGPIRSGRTTDEAIIDALNYPVFTYSGANTDFLAALAQQPVVNVNGDTHPGLFFRGGTHPAPHNFFANATNLEGLAIAGKGPPPALFDYRTAGQTAGAGVTPDAAATVTFPAATATWTWQPTSGTWTRTQNGTADVDVTGAQVSASNVVIQSIPYVTALVEANGTIIPKGEEVGTGQAWVLTNGGLVTATWTRTSLTSVTTFKDSAGNPVLLTPGKTWVELLPSGRTPTFKA